MRTLAMLSAAVIAGGAVWSSGAGAVPAGAPAPQPRISAVLRVAAGCGWGFHRNRRGHCVRTRRVYYRTYPASRPYWPGYYGDGHEPWNRPTPGDHIANRLNRQQLGGGWYRPY